MKKHKKSLKEYLFDVLRVLITIAIIIIICKRGIRTLVWVFPLFKSWDCICKYNFTVGLKYAIIHKRKYL